MSEYLLEAPNGGSIANVAYCPCGVTSTSQLLYKEFLNTMFADPEHCLGRAVFAAKCSVIARNPTNDTVYGPAILWTLFGDPALRIRHRISSAVEEPTPRLGVRTSQFGVSISPNPCDASTNIRLYGSSFIVYRSSLSVYDASGRLVLSHPVQTSSFPLGTSSFPSGVYVLRCTSGADCTSARLLVRHR
jgi:hypothetical protein